LSGANLSGANLSGANLSKADLSEANISSSVVIELQNYESMKLTEKTNFEHAISNKIDFIYYTSRFTENIPEIVNNKKELKSKLEKRGLNKEHIKSILRISNLPE
jgi:hypothetical protein